MFYYYYMYMYMFNILMNYTLLIFIMMMFFSVIMGLNSNSMLFFWISIEINSMSFLPLMLFLNKNFNDSFIKYFLIQSASSSMLLFFSLLSMMFMSPEIMVYLFMILAILMKMGMFPFHYWYLNVLVNLSWLNYLILSIIQKILPFYFLNNVILMMSASKCFKNMKFFLYFIIIMSSIISISLINSTTSIKMLFALSSLNHMTWMLLSMLTSMKIWVFYFSIYAFILISLIYSLMKLKIEFINELYILSNFNYIFKMIMTLFLIGLMSFPPLIGFFMKMFNMYMLTKYNMFCMVYILLLMSMIMFFYYLKLLLPCMMFFNMNMKNNFYMKINLIKFYYFLIMNLMIFMFIYWLLNL
uniref:NADH-ubiquinone oxidoreductase chain 2 n=1 Tax=Ibalia leucospoides TaxID=32408 RepID=A0A0E3DQK3_9HYME|nr:NADH dehydrogenase subunit 2 [Ibalia leucospoides]AIK21706.1 NADH dehydrogenase subunit 2 [Ibalia leucospoides]